MAQLTRDQILQAQDLREESYYVSEWDGEVRLRALTLAQRNRVNELAVRDGEMDATRAEAFVFIEGVVDPKFTLADYEVLRTKSVGAIERVALRIMALSGISKDALEQAIKNSSATPSGVSSST